MDPIARHPIGITLPFREGLSRLGRSAVPAFPSLGLEFGLLFGAGTAAVSLLIAGAAGGDPHILLGAAVLLPLAMQGALVAEKALSRRPSQAPDLGAELDACEPASEVEKLGCLDCDVLAKVRQFEVHRTDYVATISHELKTPLTSIKGFAQLLLRDEVTSATTVRSYAGTIMAEADRLSRIVSDVVDLTRMESGLLGLRREPMRPAELIQAVVRALQPAGSPPPLRLQLGAWLPSVRGDPERLQQVLRWLITDALRRACSGSEVLLSAEAAERGVTVRLSYGSNQERIARLLRSLEGPARDGADGQATRLGRGRLVLYISKNFIEAHGGRMWVETSAGSRVAVAFTLPY